MHGASGGSVLPTVTAVTASGENAPGEAAVWAADGDANTKWLVFSSTGWLQYRLRRPCRSPSYTLTSGGDAPERDPKNWVLKGSNDGSTWTTLDTQTNQTWADADRKVKKSYTIATRARTATTDSTIANHSGGLIQLADWDLNPRADPNARDAPMTTIVGAGPTSGYNMKARVGWTGPHALRLVVRTAATGEAFATNRLFDVEIPVGADTRLSYLIFPELTANDLQYPSTYSAVDLKFTDGSFLSDLAPRDVYDISATAEGQGAGKILYRTSGTTSRSTSVPSLRARRSRASSSPTTTPEAPTRPPSRAGSTTSPSWPSPSHRRLEPDQLRRHTPRHQLVERLLARVERGDHVGAERLQLPGPGDQRPRHVA